MNLSRADWPKKRRDVRIAGELAECEDDARICRLVVLDDEFERLTENATGFIDLVNRESRTLSLEAAGLRVPAVMWLEFRAAQSPGN